MKRQRSSIPIDGRFAYADFISKTTRCLSSRAQFQPIMLERFKAEMPLRNIFFHERLREPFAL
jgi:hypothetical protein